MTTNTMESMKAVKVMIFTNKYNSNILTVVAAVPAERFGQVCLEETRGGCRPNSCGTTLYSALMGTDLSLIRAPITMPLTGYEAYLTAIGYQFRFTVKEARGKSIRNAWAFARVFIHGRFMR